MKIKKNDNVVVIAGKDKGKTGKVLLALPKKNKVVVEGVNVAKKHQRPTRSNQKGQVVEKTMPIHVSNVLVLEGKKGVRTGRKVVAGKTIRVSKKTQKEI